VLSGTNVVQGIGQMLVLAVGPNRYFVRNNIDDDQRDEEESALQVKLEDFSSQIKILATVAAVLVTCIKWGRITLELILMQDLLFSTSEGWKESIKILYYKPNSDELDYLMIANYYINGFLLLLTILVVSVPEGLDIAASMSMALSINRLLENGILVKNVRALESIGSLDRLVFD
jgi:Ca2+-transporting ATPase